MVFDRICNRKLGYTVGVVSYAADVYLVYQLTLLISLLDDYEFLGFSGAESAVLILLFRIIVTVFFKYVSYYILYSNKNRDVRFILRSMLDKYRGAGISNEEISTRREQVVTSAELALVNFDIPFFQLLGELLVVFVIAYIVHGMLGGVLQVLPLIPVFVLFFMLIVSIYVSSKLGRINIENNKERLRVISDIFNNIGFYAINNSDNKVDQNLNAVDYRYNRINSVFSVFNSSNMVFIETMILVILASILTMPDVVDVNDLISSAPLLLRIVPSITRISAMLPQINFGLAAVKRLNDDL